MNSKSKAPPISFSQRQAQSKPLQPPSSAKRQLFNNNMNDAHFADRRNEINAAAKGRSFKINNKVYTTKTF